MIAAFAPATVSNVGCGFDVLGFALDAPGDLVTAEAADFPGVRIVSIEGDDGRLPRDAQRNTAGAAVLALLDRLGATRGITLAIHKGVPLASGIGSSGASAVAAVVAANELLGRPAPLTVLLECAMAGEAAGCGSPHPDNVAPSLLGGFVLARLADPPDIVTLPVPEGLACAVLHPHLAVETGAARALLGDTVPLGAAVRQWANLGALVAGLFRGDLALISRALEDHVAEPRRAHLVPALAMVKEAAHGAGALGCGLSGSGPSIFALGASVATARRAGEAMRSAFVEAAGLPADLWISPVGGRGAHVVAP
ncbi:MAG: homoserine kinase [Acidobacteriota bacterium]